MKRVRYVAEAAALRALMLGSRFLPRRALLGLGSAAGAVAARSARRRNRVIASNLELAFGSSLAPEAARRLRAACWRHFGRVLLDTLAFPRFSPESVDRVVRYEGLDHLRAAHAGRRGVLLFSGHFGHWELAGLMQGFLGMPMAVVARDLDNPFLERVLARFRQRSGNVIIPKRRAVREILRALDRGLSVAILIDQDARDQGVFVPFFGHPASTTPTLALIALRTGVPVLPVFSVPEPDGRYRIVYEPALEVRPTGNRKEDVERLTAECTAVMERWVRRHPELWLWMHRRWKTRPPLSRGNENP